MRVALVSSLYGGYDQPCEPPAQDTECEFILVTDRNYDIPGWRVVIEPRPSLHPRLAAKVAKCRPDLYVDADVYIWMDASFHISSDFVSWCVTSLGDGLVAQIPHPERSRLVDEAQVSATMLKYQGLPVHAQVQHYLGLGYPDGWGLWATGLRVQKKSKTLEDLGDHWLREQTRWTYQDQLSQAPLFYWSGIRPVGLDGALWAHPKFSIRSHASGL